jgi:hypothetical protein
MAKQSGLGSNLFLGAIDLSGDVGAVSSISSPRGILDITGISKSAPERLLGLRDGALAFDGFWNADASAIVDTLNNMPTTDVLSTIIIPASSSFAVGDVGAAINGKQITTDVARGQDGSLAISSNIQANGSALEWGQLLTAGKASVATGTVNQTSIDYGSTSTLFGWAAYLHVFSMASGTMGVKIEDSADNSAWLDLAGGAFTSVTGATSERIVGGVTATVRRYIRLTTTGTHGTASMAVLFVRYETSQAI